MEYFKYRRLEDKDYPKLVEWWKSNRFPPPPIDFLPNEGRGGIMVSLNGVDLCAGFMYETSSQALVWIEFIVADFEIKDRELRIKSQNFLIETLVLMAKKLNKKYIFTSLKNKGLIGRFEDCGFSIGSKGTTEMIKVI